MRVIFLLIAIIYVHDVAGQKIDIINVRVLDNRNSYQNAIKNPYLFPINNEVKLNYDQNSFLVTFRSTPGHRISYHLEDFNKGWFETIDNHLLFTNLPNGEFKLIIKDANDAKIKPALLKIVVQSPIWLKWWFLPLMFFYALILISVLLYFFFQYRLRQQLRTQFIRDNIARDLHDDMGSYLSSISILSQNVERMIENDPEKAFTSLRKIGETARQVMDTMGDIVWSVNPNYDSLDQIINRMKDFSNELFFNQDIIVDIDAEESLKKLNLTLEKKRDFFLIFKESFTNIQKYAEASVVKVKLQQSGSKISMLIEDNGKGFDLAKLPKNRSIGGNGLKNMSIRAEKLKGTLKIISKVGEGTQIKLVFEL